MLFSSITFLYYFLPLLLLIYFIVPSKFKNIILLIFSLIFYFYGEPKHIWILIFSCLINYYAGKGIEKSQNTKLSKVILIITLIINIGMLVYFKYTDFIIENINNIFNSHLSLLNIVMPIGISFFTFQTISYIIDVYKGHVKASKSIFSFATYVCLFPQLVAGPIVRYETISEELQSRKTTVKNFSQGITRFVIGLSKKILIANVLGELCLNLAGLTEATIISHWIKAISFSLQIYFDFSGYSDMAIGLGLMFGFHFLENFNFPFIASSITDFWRRWHLSLSSWFKDYVYIPLGGSCVSKLKWIRNIVIVWFLTGIWHGASWNFIVWGLYFAVLLLLEKILFQSFLKKHKIFSHIYTIFLVLISFVIFNQTDFQGIIDSLKGMFGLSQIQWINNEMLYYFKSYFVIMIISIISATPLITSFIKSLKKKEKFNNIINIMEPIIIGLLLIICTAFLIDTSFNPFLYFRF